MVACMCVLFAVTKFVALLYDSALACIDSSQLNGNELVNEKDFSSMIALLVVTYH